MDILGGLAVAEVWFSVDFPRNLNSSNTYMSADGRRIPSCLYHNST